VHCDLCLVILAGATLHAIAKRAEAAEAATGVCLLGSRAVRAGITPPPGHYFQDDTSFHSKIGGGPSLPTGSLLVANLSATTSINLPTTMWGYSAEAGQGKVQTGDAEP